MVGGIGAYLTVNLAQTLERTAREFVAGNTEIKRANVAFVELAGGVQQANANLISIQEGAAGAISQLGAIKIANQAAALGLAQTGEEFKRLTEAARVTALISPVINDIGSAISELGLAASNLSFRRLDQLGLSVTEVRDRMRDLQLENASLTDSQAFLQASVDSLTRKGKNILDSSAAQASGLERFNVAINEFLDQEGAFSNALEEVYGNLANVVNEVLTVTNYGSDKTIADFLEAEVDRVTAEYEKIERIEQEGIGFDIFGIKQGVFESKQAQRPEIETQIEALQLLRDAYNQANKDIVSGTSGALGYRSALREITVEAKNGVITYAEVADAIRNATKEYETLQKSVEGTSGADQILFQYGDTQRQEDARLASIFEAEKPINDALFKRALDSASILGVDQAIETLRQQKAAVDAAIQELAESSITNPDELAIRISQIEEQVLGFFDQLEERAESVDINFGDLALSSDQFNVDFVDFLPGMDALRDRLIDLQDELAYTGSITAEQASELDYLMGAASAAGGEAAMLADVTNDLGISFLSTNEEAAALLDQMYLATAAYLAGEIGADAYAGVISALGGELNSMATEAGVATGALATLLSVYSKFTGQEFDAGFVQGTSIVNRVNTRQEERQRRQARIDAERAAKEQQRLQEKAARDAQRAWEKAARETQKAFEEAMRQLESDLRNVPGLFSPTSVTEQDMQFSEAGIYTDQADEYLRRLRDEVLNGTDWADVSIEDAKQSLRELGINVADDNKIALQQFEQAWTNSALFADAENIAKYINDEAVQAALDLQEKARQGQQNILEHFGVVVEEAVDAVVTGAGGSYGGGGGVATIPVQAELIPANGDLTTIPTLGGVSPVIDVAAIQGQIDALDTTITLTPKVNEGAFALLIAGVKSTPVDIVAELDTTTLTTQLSQVGQQTGTINVSANLDTTKLVTDLSKISQQKGTVEIAVVAAGDNPALGFFTALDTQFKQASNFFYLIGQDTATQIRAGVAAGFAIQSPDGKEVDTGLIDYLVQRIGAEAVERQPRFTAAGAGIADFVLEGARNQFSPVAADGSVKSALATGMLDSMTQGIRANASNFQQRGQSVAEYVKAGFLNQFASETFKANIEAAGGLMAGYLKQGILANLNGLADTIASAVIDDISTSLEAAE